MSAIEEYRGLIAESQFNRVVREAIVMAADAAIDSLCVCGSCEFRYSGCVVGRDAPPRWKCAKGNDDTAQHAYGTCDHWVFIGDGAIRKTQEGSA